jgi:hypothetical protein
LKVVPDFSMGAGDVEEAVCDGSQGPTVAVSTAAQGGVFGSASGVALHSDAGPVVDRVGEPASPQIASQRAIDCSRQIGSVR